MIKKTTYILSAAAVLAAMAVSCTSQDDIYKQYIKLGGYDYPAKPLSLSTERGYKRVLVKWVKPMDPAVKTARLFWDNYADSLDVSYSDFPNDSVTVNVTDLEDRSYTFDVKNYDENGNVSLAEEITVSPYSDSWMVSRTERTVNSAEMDGDDAVISMSKMTDEMIATRFRYKDLNDEWVEVEEHMSGDVRTMRFPKALKGKRFEYSSAYCPSNGLDTVWRAWVKSTDGISYQLNGKRWVVTATKGQTFSENTPEKIFDGKALSGCRWHSSRSEATMLVFPKILSVDTQASVDNEYAFTKFTFCENPESASLRYIKNYSIYVGSSAYDPDDTEYRNHYGIQFLSGVLSTTSGEQTVTASRGATGRYLSIVFTDSWNTAEGYIDLWELIPYGYIPSQAD